MTKVEYEYIIPSGVVPEAGTQVLPELLKMLNERGKCGWRVVHFFGDPEADFFVLLEREKPDVS